MLIKKVIVILPTYNEAENLEDITKQILMQDPRIEILVVDDLSPDGTGEIADKLSKENTRIKVLHRSGPRGRGLAGIDGLRYALNNHYSAAIEIDADFSHNPDYLPKFLDILENSGVVLGSRFIKNGQDQERNIIRRLITKLANLYLYLLFNLPVKDCTSGYRGFRREVLSAIDLNSFISTGYSVGQELLLKIHEKGFEIAEIPIIFYKRRAGKPKFNTFMLWYTLIMTLRFKFKIK